MAELVVEASAHLRRNVSVAALFAATITLLCMQTLQQNGLPLGVPQGVRQQQECGAAPPPDNGEAACMRSADYLKVLTDGAWDELWQYRCDPSPHTAICDANAAHRWQWCRPPGCGARQRSKEELAAFFGGKHVAVIGDSHSRNLYMALANDTLKDLAPGPDVPDLTGKFKIDVSLDWQSASRRLVARGRRVVRGRAVKLGKPVQADSRLTFAWERYASGIANRVAQIWKDGDLPDIVIMSSGSWYNVGTSWGVYRPLNETLPKFEADLVQLEAAVRAAEAEAKQHNKGVLFLWMTIPPRVRGRDPAGTWQVDATALPPFNVAARASGMLQPRGPVFLLDMERIVTDCAPWCSVDGAHASLTVNRLLLQLTANLAAVPPMQLPRELESHHQQQQQQQQQQRSFVQ